MGGFFFLRRLGWTLYKTFVLMLADAWPVISESRYARYIPRPKLVCKVLGKIMVTGDVDACVQTRLEPQTRKVHSKCNSAGQELR